MLLRETCLMSMLTPATGHKPSSLFSGAAADWLEEDYQTPSSSLCVNQTSICRLAASGSPAEGGESKPSESAGAVVSRVLCPFSSNKTPSDYDILLPPQALEKPFSTALSSPPPPPPARHSLSFSSLSTPSSSSSCVAPRPHRPSSGHEHVLLAPDTVLDMLSSPVPPPPARRHNDGARGSRGCLDVEPLPPSQGVSTDQEAPARPPKPFPRKIPPDGQPAPPPSLDSHNEDAKIAKLMGEGYSFDDVKRALTIAQFKMDVARNILREFAFVAPRLNF